MKNLFKSVSASGNPAKFVNKGGPAENFDYIDTIALTNDKKEVSNISYVPMGNKVYADHNKWPDPGVDPFFMNEVDSWAKSADKITLDKNEKITEDVRLQELKKEESILNNLPSGLKQFRINGNEFKNSPEFSRFNLTDLDIQKYRDLPKGGIAEVAAVQEKMRLRPIDGLLGKKTRKRLDRINKKFNENLDNPNYTIEDAMRIKATVSVGPDVEDIKLEQDFASKVNSLRKEIGFNVISEKALKLMEKLDNKLANYKERKAAYDLYIKNWQGVLDRKNKN